MSPLIVTRETYMSLYGLSHIRDDRLHAMFEHRKVKVHFSHINFTYNNFAVHETTGGWN